MESEEGSKKGLRKWVKRLGVAGFLFFLIKGLLWLVVPAALLWWSAIMQA